MRDQRLDRGAEPGRGFLPISTGLMSRWFPEMPPPVWGALALDGITPALAIAFGELRLRLLLPEEYSIIGVYFHVMRFCWYVLLESQAIPTLEPFEELPVAIPTYCLEADGSTHLVCIGFARTRPRRAASTDSGPAEGGWRE